MKRLAVMILAIALGGCGPSLSSLLANKHYREAICAANDGSKGDRASVARAIANDSELYVHAHVLSEKELERLLGASTDAVMQRADFVRMRIRTNSLPIDQLDAWVELRNVGGTRSAAPASWTTLAWATGEKLPARQRVATYATPDNVLKGLGAVFSVGLSLPFTEFRPGELEVDAPRSTYLMQAPLATALHDALTGPACRSLDLPGGNSEVPRSSRDCERFYVVEKSRQGTWRIVVKQRFVALRSGKHITDTDDDARCWVEHESELELGRAQSLRADAETRFGPKMVRISIP